MNTGYDDKYAKKFHIGTEAREISTPETEVSNTTLAFHCNNEVNID